MVTIQLANRFGQLFHLGVGVVDHADDRGVHSVFCLLGEDSGDSDLGFAFFDAPLFDHGGDPGEN